MNEHEMDDQLVVVDSILRDDLGISDDDVSEDTLITLDCWQLRSALLQTGADSTFVENILREDFEISDDDESDDRAIEVDYCQLRSALLQAATRGESATDTNHYQVAPTNLVNREINGKMEEVLLSTYASMTELSAAMTGYLTQGWKVVSRGPTEYTLLRENGLVYPKMWRTFSLTAARS